MDSIFISYSSRDQSGYDALLEWVLVDAFGSQAVFTRSSAMEVALPAHCRLLVLIIGNQWHSEPDRIVIDAIARGLTVIPVLVGGARMPERAELPDELREVTGLLPQFPLNRDSVRRDVERLLEEVRRSAEVRSIRRQKRELTQHLVRTFELGHPHKSRCRIGVITGDIRHVKEALIWVNGENANMEMARVNETSISAIIRFRGGERNGQHVIAEELAAAVAGSTPVQPGSAIVTNAGRLRGTHGVHNIIHVAAVTGEPEAGFRQIANIGVCATNALDKAEAIDVDDGQAKSILFPILGTGEGHGEIRPTLRALIDSTVEHLDRHRETTLETVYFLAYFDVELDEFIDYVDDHPFLTELRS